MKVQFTSRYHDDEWRSWFAWRPVRLDSGMWVWLERVERTPVQTMYAWNYRELKPESRR